MRTAPRWFLRRAQQLFPSNSSATIFVQRTLHNVDSNLNLRRPPLLSLSPCSSFCTGRSLHTDNAAFTSSVIEADESTVAAERLDVREPKELPKLSRWMQQLNKYLPADLRISLSEELWPQENGSHIPLSLNARQLEKISVRAKNEEDIDLLVWLVENDHRKTAVWLMETILNYPSSKRRAPALRSPSNIDWPQDLFALVEESAIDLLPITRPTSKSISNEDVFEPRQFASREAQVEQRLLSRVWQTLGVLIIKSAAAGKGDTMDDNMLTALLVLGHIHNLGLMPDDVYAYNHLYQPTFVQRPPILNLVSSRILTALSDVAWRQQQDDAIVQAAHMGMSLKEISKSVPGGRFRLKVRPLGPEIWLELILWCCIESNQTTAALAIVQSLAAQSEEPWFAIRWTLPQSREKLSNLVDWDRIKLRHGGPVGLTEGYSREKPLVDVPEKTISVEVILALVEKLLTVSLSSSLTNTSRLAAITIHKDSRSLRRTMTDIEDVLTFLEPHDLPIGYFDYLETRLLQDGAFDTFRAPVDLYTWSTRMRSIRDLQKADSEKSFQQILGVEEIRMHSQLHIGFQQQAMTALVQFGDVHHTLAIFNEIQEGIDKIKVASITDFLQQPPVSVGDTPSSRPNHELEFTNCHAQLPYHKLAGFLNLISDTKLVGLGRWLLYADDVDGATLPERARDQPCMTAALYRFAAVSQDEALLKSTMPKKHYHGWQPSVNMLRARFDANTTLLQFDSARKDLRRLKRATGGGFGLSNIVHIGATILRLEHSTPKVQEETIIMAKDMLTSIFWGLYNSPRSDFTLAQRRLFRQQIRCILRVFASFNGSLLYEFAKTFGYRFPSSNLPLLPAKLFNVLLSAGIDTRGVAFGRKMWDTFCKTPDTPWAVELLDFDAETLYHNVDLDPIAASDTLIESGASLARNEQLATTSEIPFQQQNPPASVEETLEFDDPFFPKGTHKPKDAASAPGDPGSESSHELDNTFVATFIRGVTDAPLTAPNLQTLRLIVRAAATEMKDYEEAGLDVQVQKQQVAWAVEMFKAFGIGDRTMVEQEVQYPLNELDAKIIEESRNVIEAARQRDAYELEKDQDLEVGSPVSPMWVNLA